MTKSPDINATLLAEGPAAVLARSDQAHKFNGSDPRRGLWDRDNRAGPPGR